MHISRRSTNVEKRQLNVKLFLASPEKYCPAYVKRLGDPFSLDFPEFAAVSAAQFYPVAARTYQQTVVRIRKYRRNVRIAVALKLPRLHEHPKTEGMDPEAGRRVEAVCGPATLRASLPASAPHYPEFTPGGAFRIRHRAARVRALPVLDPFVDISEHVVKIKSVRGFISNRMRALVAVLVVPRDCIQSSRCSGRRPFRPERRTPTPLPWAVDTASSRPSRSASG